jgi:hypothetical protein
MGHLEGSDFGTVAPPIWQEFVSEGKTAEAVERVLKVKFRIDADDPDAPDVTPYISRQTARDILAGRFAPQDLTVTGTIHGIMPLAFVPQSAGEQYKAYQDDEDEDHATYISTEAVQARRIKASTKARAPRNYANMMDALRASSMVWSVLFHSTCPFVQALNSLRSALSGHKEQIKDHMTPSNIAGLMWALSMAVHTYILSPYDSVGNAPQPRLHYLIVGVRSCVFPSPINTPMGFSGGPDPPSRMMSFNGTYGQQDSSFGETTSNRQPRQSFVNPNVNPTLKAIFDRIRQMDPNVGMSGLRRGSNVRLNQVVLVDGNCVDFHSFGVCKRGSACNFQHDVNARPTPERVAQFLDLVKPIADNFGKGRPSIRGRGGGPVGGN